MYKRIKKTQKNTCSVDKKVYICSVIEIDGNQKQTNEKAKRPTRMAVRNHLLCNFIPDSNN